MGATVRRCKAQPGGVVDIEGPALDPAEKYVLSTQREHVNMTLDWFLIGLLSGFVISVLIVYLVLEWTYVG
jgi:hypothetical protein